MVQPDGLCSLNQTDAILPDFIDHQAFPALDSLAYGEGPFAKEIKGIVQPAGEERVRIKNHRPLGEMDAQLVTVASRREPCWPGVDKAAKLPKGRFLAFNRDSGAELPGRDF